MPNVVQVLKAEITRLARKEARAAVAPVRKPSVRLRKDVADLKRRVALLLQENKQLLARLTRIETTLPAPAPETEKKGWISGKGVRSLRKRLGLSQSEFAKLIQVSDQAVYMWESKPGMLKLRGNTKAAIFSVRGLGAREARKRLEDLKPKKVVGKRAKARRRRK